MPLLGAVQTPTTLSSGEKLAVLNAENLANNGLTMAVSFHPQPIATLLAIYNNSGQSVSLVASPDLTSGDFLPVLANGTAVTVAAGNVDLVTVMSGLYYAIKAGGAITAGTIWLAR